MVPISDRVATIFREEHGKLMASLVRRTGDFELAEEALAHAFERALVSWQGGMPDNPAAWLATASRNRAIDSLRKARRHRERAGDVAAIELDHHAEAAEELGDDRLRLIFTCCHPSLALEAQVALTLRTVCGISTERIAEAFLVPRATMAQRLVRAKNKIRAANIPYRVPGRDALEERIAGVAAVVYLVFNVGYSSPHEPGQADLCAEATWLARLLVMLLPGVLELRGLLALILLHGSRVASRIDASGHAILLADQDRTTWDRAAIAEGRALTRVALAGGAPGPYAVQAAIAALHAEAPTATDTDWEQIVGLYGVLLALNPTPIIELNRAVAVAMARGPEAGLALIDALTDRGELPGYHLLPSARADLLRRLGRDADAADAYRAALALAPTEGDRRFLERRLAELG